MAYPRWLAKINKRVFNPGQVKKGEYPVVTHVGRISGNSYQTPLDAHPTKDGYVLVVRYGPESDWVRNIVAAGSAKLRLNGEVVDLDTPHLTNQEGAVEQLPTGYEPGKDFYKADDFLLMAHAG